MLLGTRERTKTVRHNIDGNGEPSVGGALLCPGGWDEKIRREHESVCVSCGSKSAHGEYTVGVVEYGFIRPFYTREKFVVYDCMGCLHERDPNEYPYESPGDMLGGY